MCQMGPDGTSAIFWTNEVLDKRCQIERSCYPFSAITISGYAAEGSIGSGLPKIASLIL